MSDEQDDSVVMTSDELARAKWLFDLFECGEERYNNEKTTLGRRMLKYVDYLKDWHSALLEERQMLVNAVNAKTPDEELAYENGSRMAWLSMFRECLRHLQGEPEARAMMWVSERTEAIAALRRVCGEYGDNDWDENLHLADIIEKHLGKHLDVEES